MTPQSATIIGFVIGLVSAGLALTGYWIGLNHGMNAAFNKIHETIDETVGEIGEREDKGISLHN